MQIETTHFGAVQIEADDILLFPQGLIGYAQSRHWVLLADGQNPSLGWLQSISDADLAIPVVSPRRFVGNYQVRVSRRDIVSLDLKNSGDAHVLAVLSRNEEVLTVNLKAPLLINLDLNLGRQVVVNDDQPISMPLAPAEQTYRKSA